MGLGMMRTGELHGRRRRDSVLFLTQRNEARRESSEEEGGAHMEDPDTGGAAPWRWRGPMSQPDRSTLGPLGELTPTGTAAIPHALPVHQASEAHREVNRELGRATSARNAAGAEGRARQRERSWRRGPGTVRARRWVERGQVQLLLVEDDDSELLIVHTAVADSRGSCTKPPTLCGRSYPSIVVPMQEEEIEMKLRDRERRRENEGRGAMMAWSTGRRGAANK
ncbi:uncharacterized protein LOC123444158 [Hordeum vulgare subsp. vulgare]|uniref:uncharacterized protein LOC123444158 n=1 Tax=Hordeum vulgare subsp. vulgare TaxID=112509 RepID=UPI001D1A496A|nr:uncharacterized protein LOC123444158 [Hordeum vulgare subsp. vulgare]